MNTKLQKSLGLLNHRDTVLVLALVAGLLLGERSRFLADISVYSLALVMVFATAGFSFRSWIPLQRALLPMAWSALLNYLVFGSVLIGLAYLFFSAQNQLAFLIGFILLAAAPPGPSVIPFSTMMQGDEHFSITGVFGLHLLAMILTPLLLLVFLGQTLISPMAVFSIMIKLIVIPLIISRLLRHPRVLPGVLKARDNVVKWGFFLVVTPIMGMSAPLFLSEPGSALLISAVCILAMYGLGLGFHLLMQRLGYPRPFIISANFMMVTKSSAFSAVAAFSFFADEPGVALPSAVVSVFVTLFIIVYSAFIKWHEKPVNKNKKTPVS